MLFPNTNHVIRVMIVDDHQVVIDGIRAMLDSSERINVVGIAHNGKDALQSIKILDPHIVLLDINMPEMDGIECASILQKQFPAVKVLILSMLKEYSMVRKALAHGAKGYVLKNEGREQLIEAIMKVAAGDQYLSEGVRPHLKHSEQDITPIISRREKQVLKLIVDQYTGKEIAAELFISINTVDAHRKNLLMKLNARNTAGLVRIALENGLIE